MVFVYNGVIIVASFRTYFVTTKDVRTWFVQTKNDAKTYFVRTKDIILNLLEKNVLELNLFE